MSTMHRLKILFDDRSRVWLTITLFLTVLIFTGNYFHAQRFGIYEDDYFFTIQGYGWTWADCKNYVHSALISWPQGRPVGFALTHLITWISAQPDSLLPGYYFGALILVFNSALLFAIASKFLPPLPALIVAGVYCLYPVDASRMILMHRAFQLLNFTFLLLAFHSYLQGRFTLAYFAATLSLLTYESFFFPFLLAPLLVPHPRELRWKRLIIHVTICAGIVAASLLVRKAVGDGRVGEVFGSLPVVIEHMIKAMGIGPWTALKETALRLLEVLRYSDSQQWIFIFGTIFGVFLLNLPPSFNAPHNPDVSINEIRPMQSYVWLALVGLALMTMGYVLAFRPDNYPPVATIGRLSAFGTPGSFGAAFFFGSLLALLGITRISPHITKLLAGLFLGGLVSFGLQVQRTDYVRSWELQKEFWRPLLATSGEWAPGVPVVVNIEGHGGTLETPGFPSFWVINSAPMFAPYVCTYPDAWMHSNTSPDSRKPRIYGYYNGMKSTVLDSERIMLNAPPWSNDALWPVLRNKSFVYFAYEQGRLQRIETPVMLDGHRFIPKPAPDAPVAALPSTKLYKILFEQPPTWPTFSRAYAYPH